MYGVARTLPGHVRTARRKGPSESPPHPSSVRRRRRVRRRGSRRRRRKGARRPRGAGMERPPSGPGGRCRLHEELDRPDRALRGPHPPARQREGRRSAPVLQARDARAGAGGKGGESRASAQGRHDHPRPVGRAARQGDDRRERRLRRRLGHRSRSPADHGAAARPGPHRGARRAGRERLRPRAVRAAVPAERGCGGAARPAIRVAAGAGCQGAPGDPDHRRLRRRDQRRVQACRARDRSVDAQRRRRDRRSDGGRLRGRRRRRGAPLRVPRPAPAQARAGGRAADLGGPPPAGRPRGERRRARAGRVQLAQLERDRERRGRLPGRGSREQARHDHDPAADVERAARRGEAVDDRQAAPRRRAAGRAVLPADHARARPRGRWLPRARGGVPGHLVRDPARPGHRLRVERDVRRLRPRRPVRRDAVRGERHDVPLPRRVSSDDDVRRRDDRRSARRARSAARVPGDGARAGPGVRDRRRQAGGDLGEALDARSRARLARLLPRHVDEPRPLRARLRPRRVDDGADVQLGLRRQPEHRAVHERAAPGAPGDGRPRPAHQGHGRLRVAGLPARLRARADDQPGERRDPQLEQQAGARLRWRRRRVDVGPGAAGRPALGRHPAAAEAHALERRRRDERRRDPGPAAHARLAGAP